LDSIHSKNWSNLKFWNDKALVCNTRRGFSRKYYYSYAIPLCITVVPILVRVRVVPFVVMNTVGERVTHIIPFVVGFGSIFPK